MAKRSLQTRAIYDKRWTEDEAKAVLDEWKQSGLSGAEFARQHDLVPQRLYWWRERLGESESATFLPVVLRPEAALTALGSRVLITSRGGVRIEVSECDAKTAAWVATLLRSLDGSAP